jgi:hypothetical protein
VLSGRLPNNLETEFRLKALEIVPEGGRKPIIFQSEQSYQFTFAVFTDRK